MEQTFRYKAFISYRHTERDKKIAGKLQKKLESYKPPKGIASEEKWKIFRDETRRRRRNTTVAAAVAMVALTFSVYSIYTMTTIRSQNNELEQKNNALVTKTDELNRSNANLTSANNKLDLANIELADINNSLDKSNVELEQKNKELDTANAELENKNTALDTANAELENKNNALDTANSELENKNTALDSANSELEKSNSDLAVETREALDNLDEANTQRQRAEENLALAEEQKQLAEENLALAEEQRQRAEDNLAFAEEQRQRAEEEKQRAEENLRLYRQKNAELNIANAELTAANSERTFSEEYDRLGAIDGLLNTPLYQEDSSALLPSARRFLNKALYNYSAIDMPKLQHVLDIESMTEDFSFSPDRRSIVAYDARNTYVFDVATGELIYKAHEDSMIEAAFSDNEHIFVNTGFDIKNIAFADGTVAWSKPAYEYAPDTDAFFGNLRFSKDFKRAALFDSSGYFLFLDTATGEVLYKINLSLGTSGFFFTNQCTDFSDGVHFTTVYYNEYGDSSNSWNICLDIENHTFTKVYNNRGSSILATRYVDNRTIASVENNNYLNPNDPEYGKTFINFIGLGGDVVRKVALLSLLHQRTACGKIGKRRAIINSFQRRIYYNHCKISQNEALPRGRIILPQGSFLFTLNFRP